MQRNNRALVPVERAASSLCPHVWGGASLLLYKERSYTTWPANSNQVGQPGSFQTVAGMRYSDMETMSVSYLAQQFMRVYLSKSLEQTIQQRLLYSDKQKS